MKREKKKLKTQFNANLTKWEMNEKYFIDDILFSILNDDDQPYVRVFSVFIPFGWILTNIQYSEWN